MQVNCKVPLFTAVDSFYSSKTTYYIVYNNQHCYVMMHIILFSNALLLMIPVRCMCNTLHARCKNFNFYGEQHDGGGKNCFREIGTLFLQLSINCAKKIFSMYFCQCGEGESIVFVLLYACNLYVLCAIEYVSQQLLFQHSVVVPTHIYIEHAVANGERIVVIII